MFGNGSLICCNFSPFPLNSTKISLNPHRNLLHSPKLPPLSLPTTTLNNTNTPSFLKPHNLKPKILTFRTKGVCCSVLKSQDSEEGEVSDVKEEGRDWTTSILLFVLWGVLIYYVSSLSPNQTPSQDLYFLKKLLNLKGDDGFKMNEVLVSLWYIMGLWPLLYSMLLLPTGRSSKSSIPVWPFLILSCFGGAYALLPYFVLWRPPPPPVEESELGKWPLNFLESKLTAAVSLAAGAGLILYAGLANGDVWKEFYQYFRESKFIHVMSIDFTLLSTFAPFWVYNDMTARKWYDKGSWLLPLSLVPLIGPALYLVLRPGLSEMPVSVTPTSSDQK